MLLHRASAVGAVVRVVDLPVARREMAGASPTADIAMRQPVTAYLGLGANLGDARGTLGYALQQLGQTPGIDLTAKSAFYRTAPIESSGPDYINAVAQISTRLTAPELLSCLLAIETRAGRERPYRNAPRTLDLDVLMYGEGRMTSPALTIPHPRMGTRAFVLIPLAEIAPQCVAPGQLHNVREQTIERLS
jgi:2-amino-4-hydroxy-6-hydroxymethyldihydropteridine diphosphokinase